MITYYDILEVSKNASNNEIKKSYKKLVKKYHPDVFKGDTNIANEKIKELNEAYETLSNLELRRSYDEILFAPTNTSIDFSDSCQVNKASDLSPDEKYEDLYRYDYYKKYTTHYYGVSRDDLKAKKSNVTNKKEDTAYISSVSRLKLIVVFGIIAIVLIILLICLLSYIKLLFKSDSSNTNTSSVNILPYISFGMSYDYIEDRIGTPDSVEYKSDNMYAYWGDSYIIFDKYDYVIGWHNYGGVFLTETVTGEDFTSLQEFYNMIQTDF